jgi:PAS domain S-box-containing protein
MAVFFILFSCPAYSSETASLSAKTIKIGVLAKRGPEQCLDQWAATADYLTETIANHTFKIIPLGFKEIYKAVGQNEVDFVLANSAIYVELESLYGINRIATMENLRQGKGYKVFGGVIFCKAVREDIKHLADLKGKSFMAVEENSFGGWIMAWRELKNHNIDPYEDLRELRFGGTHDAVVYAVLEGSVDAGTVRTDTIERMVEEGRVNQGAFFVLDEHQHGTHEQYEQFPFLHSTALYPEWPFAKVKQTSDELAKEVTIALLNMNINAMAVRKAQVAGWTTPLSYQSVDDCFKELKIGSYAAFGEFHFKDVVEKYFIWIVVAGLVMLIMAFGSAYVLKLNRELFISKKQLAESHDKLESRVQKRTEEFERLNEELQDEMFSREQAEQETRKAYDELEQIINTSSSGMTVIDTDYNVARVNDTFSQLLGVAKSEVEGRKCYEAFPSHRCETAGCPMKQILGGQEKIEIEDVKRAQDGRELTCIINAGPFLDSEGNLIGIVESFMDISERKRDEIALAEFAGELSRSNAELQQFAYVASHDLQEPLRMVASYVQLLAKRYGGKLDADADEFIHFAVDGANRMKALIQDLLQYSRVNTKGKEFEATDCEEVLERELANLQLTIADSGATITHDSLPILVADGLQLGQLFQNLIGNAIKFHGDEPPQIHISVTKIDAGHHFSVKDNGIGIDPQYRERIFDIFQRLHGKDKYAGTGIGLAVCRKIVERHGGKIWVESEPGKGSVFHFIIPFGEVGSNDRAE